MSKYHKRGEDCEYTEDCMWGVDGWCDRPEGKKCVIEDMDMKGKKEKLQICRVCIAIVRTIGYNNDGGVYDEQKHKPICQD